MTDEHGEVLSRLLDGEPVDETKLRNALAQPEAADLLLEWAGLRQLLRADLGQPDDEFCDTVRQRLRTSGWRRLVQERVVPVGVAASLLAAASLGYGLRWWVETAFKPVPSSVQTVAGQQTLTPPAMAPAVAPLPSTQPGRRANLRSVVPTPRARVPFVQWRDSSLPN